MIGVVIAGFSSLLTGLNFVVTTHWMRAPGLTWFRLPIFVWTLYATSIIFLLAVPVLAMALLLVVVERIAHIGIFDPRLGGDPLLFQHLFWFYSHPAVYVMILPGMGIVSEIIPCFARKSLYGYNFVAYSSMGIACFGLSGVGPSYVRGGHLGLLGAGLFESEFSGGRTFGNQGIQLDGDALQGLDLFRHPDVVRAGFCRIVHNRRPDRIVSGDARHGYSRA